MEIPTYISNYEAVTDFYGYWPSFHDAKVVSYGNSNDNISLTLHAWHITKEVDGKGYYVLKNHALVKFYFKGVFNVNMASFSVKNILFEMSLLPESDLSSFDIELDSVMDMSGSFSARSGEVVSIEPCTADGK